MNCPDCRAQANNMTISRKLQLWLLTAALFAGIMLILMFLILMFGCGAAHPQTRCSKSSVASQAGIVCLCGSRQAQ